KETLRMTNRMRRSAATVGRGGGGEIRGLRPCSPRNEMKKRLTFLLAVYAATVAFMAVQKPVFLWFHASEAAAASAGDWWRVIAHGLSLDLTVAGYIAAVPWLLTLTSLWVPLREAVCRRV